MVHDFFDFVNSRNDTFNCSETKCNFVSIWPLRGVAPPKHSRLAPSRAILLVLSLAFARFIRHRRRSQRSLTRLRRVNRVQISPSAPKKQKTSPNGLVFCWRRRRDLRLSRALLRKALFSLLRKLGDFCSVPAFYTKQKAAPKGTAFYLAQKERFELSRRLPDLHP